MAKIQVIFLASSEGTMYFHVLFLIFCLEAVLISLRQNSRTGHPGISRASQLNLSECADSLSNPGTYSHNQFESMESSYYRTSLDKRSLICTMIKLILMIRGARGFSKTIVEIAALNTVKGE